MAATSRAHLSTPVERHVFSMQYVSTPTADTIGTTLLLKFDSKRYLFGHVSEGTQRVATERGVSLKKNRHMFISGETKWETNGGLLGMMLTIADVAASTDEDVKPSSDVIHIHGGPKLLHTIACARRFIFRTGMPLNTYEASAERWKPSNEPDFFDENVLLWALPVQSSDASDGTREMSSQTQEEQELRKRTVHNMFNSDWHKDKLHEATFSDIVLPAMIWVRDPSTKDLQATWCTKPSDAPHVAPDQKVLVRMPWPAALVPELPSAEDLLSGVAISYLVKGRPQRGKFMADKAKAAGVPSGPDFGKLSGGNPVTLDDGRVVNPADVMGPTLPGYGVAVLDIPRKQYLSDLASKLTKMREVNVLVDIHAFCWTLGPDVIDSQAFKSIIEAFPDVKHFISAPEYAANTLAMDATAASTTRLNAIRPDTFIVPRHDNQPPRVWSLPQNYVLAQRGLGFQLAPDFKILENEIPRTANLDAVRETMSTEAKSLIPAASANDDTANGPYDDVTVTTLGTGSALPSKYRNVSANLLHIPALGYFMLDCGENTIGQLRRIFTPEELDEVLCNLHMIWISHLHADHHLGTVSVLMARKLAIQRRTQAGQPAVKPIYLISERNMADFLEDYRSVEHHHAIMIRCLNSELTDLKGRKVTLSTTTLPIRELQSTRVSHCHGAQAISVTFSNGFKLSYSGDCRPSANFAKIGQNSDILIHEATFDDGLEGDAMAKRHCTTGEAVGVANAMKARNVILTHFSQRYQKLPELTAVKAVNQIKFEDEGANAEDNAPISDMDVLTANTLHDLVTAAIDGPAPGANGPKTPALKRETSLETAAQKMPICVAFDFMRVTIPQIKDMYKYYPAFESMFEYEQEKSDQKRIAARDAEGISAKMAAKHARKIKNNIPNNAPKSNKQNGRKAPKAQNQPTIPPVTSQIAASKTAAQQDFGPNKRNMRSASPASPGKLDRKKQKVA